MRTKRILSFILAACLFCTLCSAFAADPGTAQDPLVSKSYIDNTYPSVVLGIPRQNLQDIFDVLEHMLAQNIGTGPKSNSVMLVGTITASAGSSFSLLSGVGKISELTGTVIDVTDGVTVSNGQYLTAGHRYVVGGDSILSVLVSSTSRISSMGSVNVSSTGKLTFSDIPASAWYYNNILYTVGRGLVDGRDASSYDPYANLTLTEAIKLAACIHQLNNTGKVTLTVGSPWYAPYVQYALDNGIIQKASSNYNVYINRRDFVEILYAALPSSAYKVINTVSDNIIPDVKTSDKTGAQIYSFYRAGVLIGRDAVGTFSPDDFIMRCEVAAIITRMLEAEQRLTATLK